MFARPGETSSHRKRGAGSEMLIGSSAERAAKEKRVRTPGVAAEEKKWRISRAIRIMERDSIKGRLTSDERIEFARFGPLPVPLRGRCRPT